MTNTYTTPTTAAKMSGTSQLGWDGLLALTSSNTSPGVTTTFINRASKDVERGDELSLVAGGVGSSMGGELF